MNYTRKQVIDLIFPAMFTNGNATPESIRGYISRCSDQELVEIMQKQISAGYLQIPSQPAPQPQQSTQVTQEQVEEARQQAEQELREIRQQAEERIANAEADRLQQWSDYQARVAQENEPRDRETFQIAAQSLGFGNNLANWTLIKAALGTNFTVADIQHAIRSGKLLLSPPSERELLYAENQTRQQLLTVAKPYLEDRGPESFQIRRFIKNAPLGEVQPRVELVAKIAEAHSRDPEANKQQFRKLFISVTNIGQLKSIAEQIEQRQQLRSMSKQELREFIRSQNQGVNQ